MGAGTDTDAAARLLRPAAPGRFDPGELAGLAPPVRRHLAQAIAPGTALYGSARLWMRGQIKVGRWLPFRARQVLDPHRGFVWTARAAGLIAGVDRYLDGAGLLDWKLAGLVTVAHGEGPDVSRSAAGRAGAEGIWLPTALLPHFGVRWSAPADDRVVAAFRVGETPLALELRLDGAGRIVALGFDRWGDPAGGGGFGWHRFGGEITGHASFAGLTIPPTGRTQPRVGLPQGGQELPLLAAAQPARRAPARGRPPGRDRWHEAPRVRGASAPAWYAGPA